VYVCTLWILEPTSFIICNCCVLVISASSICWCGMSNATEIVTSWTDKTGSLEATDEMQSGSFVPSRLTLSIYHRLTSFAVYCMSTSATAVLIFLLLFWYYGGICLLIALLISVLGELELSDSYGHLAGILFVLMSFVFCLYYISSNTLILAKNMNLLSVRLLKLSCH